MKKGISENTINKAYNFLVDLKEVIESGEPVSFTELRKKYGLNGYISSALANVDVAENTGGKGKTANFVWKGPTPSLTMARSVIENMNEIIRADREKRRNEKRRKKEAEKTKELDTTTDELLQDEGLQDSIKEAAKPGKKSSNSMEISTSSGNLVIKLTIEIQNVKA